MLINRGFSCKELQSTCPQSSYDSLYTIATMLSSKLSKYFKTIHSNLQDKYVSYFKRLFEQQAKKANYIKSVLTVSDKPQIASRFLSSLRTNSK